MDLKRLFLFAAGMAAVVGAILLVTLVRGGNVEHAFAFWGEHLIIVAIWLVLTLSLNLINGYCGLFSLGHQGFWAAGAYAAAATVVYLPHGSGPHWVGFFMGFSVWPPRSA